jgi:hypothetical protein
MKISKRGTEKTNKKISHACMKMKISKGGTKKDEKTQKEKKPNIFTLT